MGRDDRLLRRLYARGGGASRPPEVPVYGIVPALWVGGLGLLVVASAFVAVVSLLLALRPSPREQQLRAWGIVGADETAWAFHDHSARADGSSGCVAIGDRVVRFDDRVTTASVALPGAEVQYDLDAAAWVVIRNGDASLTCPFGLGEGAQTFADLLRVTAARPVRTSWGPGRDPRL